MGPRSDFDHLVEQYRRENAGVDLAVAIEKVADSPAGRDVLVADREAMTASTAAAAPITHEHDEVSLGHEIRKQAEVEDLIDFGARDLQRRSEKPLGDGEALEAFLRTDVGKVLYEILRR